MKKVVIDMEEILVIAIFIGIAFLAIMYIPALMIRRAMVKIMGIFCRYNAVGVGNAMTIDELGLRPPDFFQRLISARDYKPYALHILRQTGIITSTDDGKLYMMEDKLDTGLRCGMDLAAQTGRKS
jgi:hypothetical protein